MQTTKYSRSTVLHSSIEFILHFIATVSSPRCWQSEKMKQRKHEKRRMDGLDHNSWWLHGWASFTSVFGDKVEVVVVNIDGIPHSVIHASLYAFFNSSRKSISQQFPFSTPDPTGLLPSSSPRCGDFGMKRDITGPSITLTMRKSLWVLLLYAVV